MTTRFDDGPESGPFGPGDPLAVILRPASGTLGPPPGRYEAVRRAAFRRRLLRTAAGAGLSCAVAALVALPLYPASPGAPAPPAVPQAPPSLPTGPATPATPPDQLTPPVSPEPPGLSSSRGEPGPPAGGDAATRGPSEAPATPAPTPTGPPADGTGAAAPAPGSGTPP